MPTRYEIVFSGRVQGVGFRFTTARIAGRHAVSGWVRNEPDGTVRCVIEGDRTELDRFVAAVQEAMAGNIVQTQVDRTEIEARSFDAFGIRR